MNNLKWIVLIILFSAISFLFGIQVERMTHKDNIEIEIESCINNDCIRI